MSRPRRQRRRAERARAGIETPWQLGIPALLGAAFLVLPLVALLLRAPWSSLGTHLADPLARDALRLSLVCAGAASGLSIVFGVPLGWVLAHADGRGAALLRALVTVPLVLPPVVGGVALLLALGRTGVAGRWLQRWFGLTLPFTTAGAVLAATFVAMPFLVLAMEGAFRSVDAGLEEVAATLGASRWFAFRQVVLPGVLPGLVSGAVLAWARALGEFGATIMFAGSLSGRTQTMPLLVYSVFERSVDAAVWTGVLLLGVALVALLLSQWLASGEDRPE